MPTRLLFIVLAWLFALAPAPAMAEAKVLRVMVPATPYYDRPEIRYFYQLLELALRKTEDEGPFLIEFFPEGMSLRRSLEELRKNNRVNVFWTTPDPERQQHLLPVKVSLIGELNSYRILLIRKGEQARFDNVASVNDLRKLRAGLGADWPDFGIVQRNGLPVEPAVTFQSLFPMLEVKRFDYVPLGLYEIWSQVAASRDGKLVAEEKLMLYYDLPFWFFVNKANRPLAERIERGLKLAQADGSFEQLFTSVPTFKRALEEQRNSRRRVIVLKSR